MKPVRACEAPKAKVKAKDEQEFNAWERRARKLQESVGNKPSGTERDRQVREGKARDESHPMH